MREILLKLGYSIIFIFAGVVTLTGNLDKANYLLLVGIFMKMCLEE